jgi:retron-type reverse transcriptase
VYIAKTDGRLRPLGIAALEDKIVQRAIVEVLNAIYETDCAPRGAVSSWEVGDLPGRLSQRPV